MKIKTIIFLIFILCPILIIKMGCKNQISAMSENHNTTICGAKEPAKKLQWLNEYCEKHPERSSTEIPLYKNETSDINHIYIQAITNLVTKKSSSNIQTQSIYSCDGEYLLFKGAGASILVTRNNFFKK